MHDFVPLKIIDQGVPCLHRMERALCLRPFEEIAQLYEAMPGAAGVERVNGDAITFRRVDRSAIREPKIR